MEDKKNDSSISVILGTGTHLFEPIAAIDKSGSESGDLVVTKSAGH